MADTFSPLDRSRIMAAVKSKVTTPEMVVRRLVHGMGYRYRLHDASLPGTPNLVRSISSPFTLGLKRGRLRLTGAARVLMIRAILKRGKIQPLDALPQHWRDGQELTVESGEPSDDPADIKKWHDQLVALSAQIPAEDHARMAAAIAEQAKE